MAPIITCTDIEKNKIFNMVACHTELANEDNRET